MKISLYRGETHENQIKKVRESLAIQSDASLELGLDSVHSLNELTRSIAQLHPHKKSIAILGAQPPPLQALISGFAADGFLIQELPVSFTAPSDEVLTQAFEKLKKDTLFVLSSAIEPLTAIFYPYKFICNEAFRRNIFSLTYFSPDALKQGLPKLENAFEGIIADPLWGEPHSLSVILKGERCQGERLLWGQTHVSDESVDFLINKFHELSQDSKVKVFEDRKLVLDAETKIHTLIASGIELLNSKSLRLYDRAVCFIKGTNGDAMVERLCEAGFDASTGAACAWNLPRLNNWLPKLGFTPENIESSLIVPIATLKQVGFYEALVKVIKELRQISAFGA
jgi:hypothetical protein